MAELRSFSNWWHSHSISQACGGEVILIRQGRRLWSVTNVVVNSWRSLPEVLVLNSIFNFDDLSWGFQVIHWRTSQNNLHVLVWFTVDIINKKIQWRLHKHIWSLQSWARTVEVCVHAVSSCQNPTTFNENSSTDVSVWQEWALWLLLHRYLPGYRPWRYFQTPKDACYGLFRLCLATS